MRNYKEQTEEIIRKTNINRQKNKIIKRNVITLCSVILVIALFSVFKNYNTQNFIADESSSESINESSQENSESDEQKEGFVIPYQKLQPTEVGAEGMDMAMLVSYNKKVYVAYSSSYKCSISEKDEIVGEYIGKGSGTIDEFSLKDEYDENLASNFSGDFYTVKGYDSDFMLCSYEIYENECIINFLETVDGRTLTTGEDLLGEHGLNLKGNYNKVYIQTHEDWNKFGMNNSGLETFTEIQLDDKTMDLLYSSEFVKYDGDVFDLDQIHIYFEMENGREVMLRYFEGGYIGYSLTNLDNIVIKVDESIEKLFATERNIQFQKNETEENETPVEEPVVDYDVIDLDIENMWAYNVTDPNVVIDEADVLLKIQIKEVFPAKFEEGGSHIPTSYYRASVIGTIKGTDVPEEIVFMDASGGIVNYGEVTKLIDAKEFNTQNSSEKDYYDKVLVKASEHISMSIGEVYFVALNNIREPVDYQNPQYFLSCGGYSMFDMKSGEPVSLLDGMNISD